MAPPPKAAAGTNFLGDNDDDRILQAVVIADSFNERFMPITMDKPRCLLPLVNVPIIEYTFEFLAISGVQEVILFCRSHADQIKQYISKSRWSKATSTMHIQIVVSPECTSLGDALRDIDSKAVIQGDFVLVSGDVVSNMNLSRALNFHRERRTADRNVIMTMVLKPSTPFHRSRERCEAAVFVIDPSNNECVHYEPIESETKKTSLDLEAALLESRRAIDLRYDLIDCQIDICSMNVLALFTENFDYQDMRKDFVRGILTSDILGHKILTYELAQDEYASRVRSSHLYDSVSRDIIGRWTFPIVPDMNLIEDQEFSIRRGNRYIGKDVMLSLSAVIGPSTVLGAGVTVGENSKITRSVIGPNCQIGANCVIDGAYIWEDVVVEGDARIESSIIADRVRLRPGVTVSRGCMITSQVTIGPKVTVPPYTRVAKWSDHLERTLSELNIMGIDIDGNVGAVESSSLNTANSSFNSNAGVASSPQSFAQLSALSRQVLGPESDGVLWTAPLVFEGEDASEGDAEVIEERTAAFTIGSDFHKKKGCVLPPDSESDDEAEGEKLQSEHEFENEDDEDYGFGGDSKFYDEAYEMTRQSVLGTYTIDNTSLELNALKFACNASFSECRRAVISALTSLVDAAKMSASVNEIFTAWAPLLSKFTHSSADQIDLINHLHSYLVGNNALSLSFHMILPLLYKLDILDDSSILTWYEEHVEASSEGSADLFARQIKGFVSWLEESEDEDDDEEEESEEETDDE